MTYLKTAVDTKYYTSLVSEIVSVIHLQGGILSKIGDQDLRMLDHFQMGPNLVRGFASNGIGPRDITYASLGPPAMRSAARNTGARPWSCRCRSGSCPRRSA